jgi:hypothetical protein
MPPKRTIAAVVIVLVAIGGFVAGLFLLRERQELREEASVPGGQAEVSLFPEVGDFSVGDTFPVSIFFNTANIAASGVSVLLTYPYSGATPEFVASNIEINSVFLSSGDWTCPTRKISAQSGSLEIEIGCANISAGGFATNTDTLLATFNMTVERVPVIEPVVLRFDSSQSVITQKSDGQDILLVPTSTGEYLVAGETVPTATAVPVASPTLAPGVTSTPTLTPTQFLTATPSPTSVTSTTPTATGAAQLPDAGISYPTIFGIGLGLFFIVGALILAL